MRRLAVLFAVLSIGYAGLSEPNPSSSQGMFLGSVGTFYMFAFLMAYSTRKRSPRFKGGLSNFLKSPVFAVLWLFLGKLLEKKPAREYLELHIITGILGPLIILFHTGLKFNGLAGISAMLMGIVVLSGFTGRVIFKRIPARDKERELEILEKEKTQRLQAGELRHAETLEKEIKDLRRTLRNIKKMKKLLSNWRSVHIPLTTLFFITVLLHIVSVYYY